MRIKFETTDGSLGEGLKPNVAPRVIITWSSEELAWTGDHVIELLRRPGGVTSAIRWKARTTA